MTAPGAAALLDAAEQLRIAREHRGYSNLLAASMYAEAVVRQYLASAAGVWRQPANDSGRPV